MKKIDVDVVAFVLAVVLGLSLVLIITTALVGVLDRSQPTLGENTTQILTAGLSGIVGVLGSYIGFRAHRSNVKKSEDEPPSS